MKNMKTVSVFALGIVIPAIILTSLALTPAESKKDVKVFVSSSSKVIEANILAWSKAGYSVKFITSQAIATDKYAMDAKLTDIILIMEK